MTEISGKIKTIYEYNYLDKPVRVKNAVKKDDVFIINTSDKEETELITTNSYDKNGNIIKTITPSNTVTEYTYDKLDRLLVTKQNDVLSEDASEKPGILSEINSYNWAGNVVKKELKFNDLIRSQTEYYYDSRNNLLLSVDHVDGKEAAHSYQYNNIGQVIAEATPESFSELDTAETDPVKKYSLSNASSRTKYIYDLIGRIKLKKFTGRTYKLDVETGKMVGTDESFVVQAYKYDANGWEGDPIDVVKMSDGKLTTIDNTRVVAAREAGIDVQSIIHDSNEILPKNLIKRFTTDKGIPETWGDAIELRIRKQKASFRNNNPLGADVMERIGR